jgi:hypothetical protein
MNVRRWLLNVVSVVLIAVAVLVPVSPPAPGASLSIAQVQPTFVQVEDELPVINPNTTWRVNVAERVSACDNRPGLSKIYVTVLDEKGAPLRGVVVRFDTHPSEGIAYDHMDVWGYTDLNGYVEWDHLAKPTRYALWMGDDEVPLIANIRTDLGNEYCRMPGAPNWSGNVPVNRPGIYSYRLEIQRME